MSDNRLVTLNEAAEIIGYGPSRFMMLNRDSGSFAVSFVYFRGNK